MEQMSCERILDKVQSSNHQMQNILGYRLHSNPHEKNLTEE